MYNIETNSREGSSEKQPFQQDANCQAGGDVRAVDQRRRMVAHGRVAAVDGRVAAVFNFWLQIGKHFRK